MGGTPVFPGTRASHRPSRRGGKTRALLALWGKLYRKLHLFPYYLGRKPCAPTLTITK